MECGETIGYETLLRRVARADGECHALAIDATSVVITGGLECDPLHILTDLAALLTSASLVRVEYATAGDVTEVDCGNHTLLDLFYETINVDENGLAILVWDDLVASECQFDCEDSGLTAEQMLRGAFVRQSNGVLRLRITPFGGSALTCDSEHISAETLMRSMMKSYGDGRFAVRYIQEA